METILGWILRLLLPLWRLKGEVRCAGKPHAAFQPVSACNPRAMARGRRTASAGGRIARAPRRSSMLARIPVELRCLPVYRNLDSVRPVAVPPAQGIVSARGAACPAAPGNHRVQSLLRLALASRLIPLLDRSGAVRRPVLAAFLR